MSDAGKIVRTRAWLAPRWEPFATKLLVLAAVGVFVKLASYIDRPVVDDALISMAYGKSFFAGDGLRVTPYSEIAEGYSNPSWTFLLGLIQRLHINPIDAAKPLGMLLSAGALPLLMLWGPVSQRRKIQLEDAIAPVLTCTNATFVYWALGGLENGILVFLIAAFGVLIWLERTRRVAVVLGITGAVLALTRPEAPLYVAIVALPYLIGRLWPARLRQWPTREDRIALALIVIPVALYVLFRRVYFSAWFPTTYYAKHFWFVDFTPEFTRNFKITYVEGFFKTVLPLLVAGGVGTLLSITGRWRVAKSVFAAVGIVGTMVVFAWFANGDWMKESRFLGTVTPFLAYPVGAGVSGVRQLLGRPRFERARWARRAVLAVLAVAVLYGIQTSTKTHEERWKAVKDEGGDVPRFGKDLPQYGSDVRSALGKLRMTHPLLAAPDMGYVSLGLREFEIIDTAGLTDAMVAHHYGNLAAMRDFFGNEGYPTLLLMWGPSNNLWPMNDLLARYRNTSVGSSYKVYSKVTPDADDRCPDGDKASTLLDTTAVMVAKLHADLADGHAVRALARWRCYFAYKPNQELPSASERRDLALEAETAAKAALKAKTPEIALRDYSLCAVVGASSWYPSTSCRAHAETLRDRLFPRPPPPKK